MSEKKTIIDVHHHIIPSQLTSAAQFKVASGIGLPVWTIEKDREAMDQLGISGALLSLPESGIPGSGTAKIIHMINTTLADEVNKAPKRYGMLASLPLQDADSALKEIEYARDTLHADGFALPSNSTGIYISDDRLEPVLAELNRRSCVVFLHPGTPAGDNLPLFGRNMAVYEFPFETTRAMMDLIYKGKINKYPKIKWIVAHAGGTIPYLAYRLGLMKEIGAIRQTPEEVFAILQTLYFDLALSTSPYVFPGLKRLARASHVLFGTDYPMRQTAGISSSIEVLDGTQDFSDEEKKQILSETSKTLFPRFSDL